MPSTSKAQQRFFGAAYSRARSGNPRSTDPDMSVAQLRDFAATKTSGLPARAPKKARPAKGYGRGPVG